MQIREQPRGSVDEVPHAEVPMVPERELGVAVMAALYRAGVPATPDNYRLWHTHLSGADPALSARLVELVQGGRAADEVALRCLSAEFFPTVAPPADKMVAALRELSSRIADQLDLMNRGTTSFAGHLVDFGRELAGGDASGLHAILSEILTETRRMRERTEVVERNLAASTEELQCLRRDLDVAWRDALTDPLTGLANRRAFDRALRRHAEEARQTGEAVALVMIDVDHFKEFNDQHGHRVGDQVLKLIAGTLGESIRGRDLAARYGGEEFAIILPETTLENATRLAERIRTVVGSRRVQIRQGGRSLGRISLSLGVSAYTTGTDPVDWLDCADRALYTAKRNGRDQVVALNEEAVFGSPVTLEPA